MLIAPSSGVCSPAMQSSIVVLPAPDAPKRIVIPGRSFEIHVELKRCLLGIAKALANARPKGSFACNRWRAAQRHSHSIQPLCRRSAYRQVSSNRQSSSSSNLPSALATR